MADPRRLHSLCRRLLKGINRWFNQRKGGGPVLRLGELVVTQPTSGGDLLRSSIALPTPDGGQAPLFVFRPYITKTAPIGELV